MTVTVAPGTKFEEAGEGVPTVIPALAPESDKSMLEKVKLTVESVLLVRVTENEAPDSAVNCVKLPIKPGVQFVITDEEFEDPDPELVEKQFDQALFS